ncbi:helix-turn-helix domain-containing protein [Bacillus haynesii]|uniref:helix-turn-helix domain-containing protein n=1 Tax=Bacillus haynesii TaxID=1925021 RepID=UPI002280CC3D|nr:helix-turn-helix transcriptional regulator [Bacillus haynesii]MCY9434197.1 helix-turn-helix transcriptional regulator [Bacillus haynesii]MEC0754633.1 helix-turn-helix transcriptional regulator [Bacillus haynesii]
MKLGENLKELREGKNLSQKALGKKLGLAESTIGMYEQGKRRPDYETLIKIADFFEVSIDYLIRGESKESQEKIFTEKAEKILNDPKTFMAARDGEVTDEIVQAALEIIAEQLKEGRKKKSD